MSCEQYKKELTDAALGVLPPENERAIRRHLASCQRCRAEFEERRRLVQAMDREIEAMVAGQPSPAFRARVRLRVEEVRLARTLRWWLAPRWVAVASGALVVLMLLAWFVRREPITPGNGEKVAENRPKAAVGARENAPVPILKQPGRRVSAPLGKRSFGRNGMRSEPEVLVEPGQDQAVVQLYAAVWRGRVDPAPLLTRSEPLVPFPELKIEPLKIEALDEEAKPLDSGPSR